MNRLMISMLAICLASAAPTVLWAGDEKHEQSKPSGGQASHPTGSNESQPSGAEHVSRPESGTRHVTTHTSITHTTSRYHHTTTTHVTIYHRHVTTSTVTKARIIETSHVKVDIATYRRNVTARLRFHYGDYRAPAGYAYRRWSYGERLPAVYFGRDYWIPNYLNFGLPWAPDGYVWVRYGSDAILIDEYTGEIVQVDYGVFY